MMHPGSMPSRARHFGLPSLKRRGVLTIMHLVLFAGVLLLLFLPVVGIVVLVVVLTRAKTGPAQPDSQGLAAAEHRRAQLLAEIEQLEKRAQALKTPLEDKPAESGGSHPAARDAAPPRP